MKNLKNSTIYREAVRLKKFHFETINDRSFVLDKNLNNSIYLGKFKTYEFLNFISEILLINPDNLFRLIFDLLIMIVTCFYFIEIPINISFNVTLSEVFLGDSDKTFKLKIASFILFLLEIVINLNTALFRQGELINDRKTIMILYAKRFLFRDLLSLTYFMISPQFLPSQNNENIKLLGLLFYLRMRNLSHIMNRFQELMFLSESTYHQISFLKLVINVYLFAHLSACVWYYIGKIDEADSWLSELGIINEVWWKKYVNSLYYIIVVMNTVGFGDITPRNYYEKIFNIFFIFFGCSIFAFIFNSIGIILQNIDRQDQLFKREMYVINGYMKQKKIDFPLRRKIRNYLSHIWEEEKLTNFEDVQKVFQKLSPSLKDELLLQSHGQIFRNQPFFFKNFSEKTLNRLSHEMKEVNLTPGDKIFTQNEICEPSIYIIRNGTVEIFFQHSINNEPLAVLETLKEGQMFGLIPFISNETLETSARSMTFTTLYVVSRESFLSIIKADERDFQTFCQIKDKLIFNNDYKKLYLQCSSCHEDTHCTKDCPFFKMIISKQRLIARNNFSLNQERSQFVRVKKKSTYSKLKKIKTLEKNSSEIIDFNKTDQDLDDTNNNISWNEIGDFVDLFANDKKSLEPLREGSENVPDSANLRPNIIFDNPTAMLNDVRRKNLIGRDLSSPKGSPLLSESKEIVAIREKDERSTKDEKPKEIAFDLMKDYDFYFEEWNCAGVIKKLNFMCLKKLMQTNGLLKSQMASMIQNRKIRQKIKIKRLESRMSENAISLNIDKNKSKHGLLHIETKKKGRKKNRK